MGSLFFLTSCGDVWKGKLGAREPPCVVSLCFLVMVLIVT